FLQTAELRTAREEVFSLNRIVADVPAGAPFFSARMPDVGRLSFAEAARWVVHVHAYDTAGIKTGMTGDDRVKGGKVYPLGTGWAGGLGGVFVEGATLRETLLLNLVAADTDQLVIDADDRPAWRREPCGPGSAGRSATGPRDLYTWQSRRVRLHHDAAGGHGVVLGHGAPPAALLPTLAAADPDQPAIGADDRPAWRREPCGPGPAGRSATGPRDLYTWQSRRVRLHHDAEGVHGVVLGYGDPLAARNMHGREPMTPWRRSPAQEKKLGQTPVYLPLEHDPARTAWRGIAALLADRLEETGGSEAPARLRPRILEWVARLVTERHLDRGFLVRTRVVGVSYGTQQSVVDEVVDDRLIMPLVL